MTLLCGSPNQVRRETCALTRHKHGDNNVKVKCCNTRMEWHRRLCLGAIFKVACSNQGKSVFWNASTVGSTGVSGNASMHFPSPCRINQQHVSAMYAQYPGRVLVARVVFRLRWSNNLYLSPLNVINLRFLNTKSLPSVNQRGGRPSVVV